MIGQEMVEIPRRQAQVEILLFWISLFLALSIAALS